MFFFFLQRHSSSWLSMSRSFSVAMLLQRIHSLLLDSVFRSHLVTSRCLSLISRLQGPSLSGSARITSRLISHLGPPKLSSRMAVTSVWSTCLGLIAWWTAPRLLLQCHKRTSRPSSQISWNILDFWGRKVCILCTRLLTICASILTVVMFCSLTCTCALLFNFVM